jgi:thioredoxin reductase (NADPH)
MESNVENLYLAGVVCGGMNTHVWFIENSRIHADMILKNIMGKQALSRSPAGAPSGI